MRDAPRRIPPRLGALLAIIFWGISFVATKGALREIAPVTLIFCRFALGAAVLHGILAVRRKPFMPPRGNWPALALMGFIGVFVHQMLQVYGLSLTSATHTGWLIGLIPIWSALLSAFILKERFGAGKLAGLALGFAGAILVVTRGRIGGPFLALPSTRGDFLILASTVNWAVYSVVGHATIRRLGPDRATAGAMVFGLGMLAPFFLCSGAGRDLAGLSPVGWGALLFLGICCSGLGYLFWYGALESVETSRVAAFLYLEPLVTLAAAVALLGERVGAVTVLGGALVLAGVYLVQRKGR
jgi:drug/metabolite transporter (DMT)-like permease